LTHIFGPGEFSIMAKILIVDDEEELRQMMRDTLELANYEVAEAKDGEEGLAKAYSEAPDAILLDVSMPKMDGYEVVTKLRSDVLTHNIPTIMLTVRASEKDEIKGLSLGVDDYIIKPFNAMLLLARMKAVLERTSRSTQVNPLTLLPGNAAIIREIQLRLDRNRLFAVLYADISNFKAYNDCYGFKNGDDVIKLCSRIILQEVRMHGSDSDFVGHIGGDDFIAIISSEKIQSVCSSIIAKFDNQVRKFYRDDDLVHGYIMTKNRAGKEQKFPIMTIAIGAAVQETGKYKHVGEISTAGTELKNMAKKANESTYVVDRRHTL